MSSCIAVETQKTTTVCMGQITAARDPDCLKAVLGSCIGVALYHPRLKVGVLSHVVLPDSDGRSGSPGKFADTAIPEMLKLLKETGVPLVGLVVKIAGGASMFAASGPMQVGENNAKAVTQALSAAGIRISGKDVGGTKGRRLTFDCGNGEVLIETIGKPPRTL